MDGCSAAAAWCTVHQAKHLQQYAAPTAVVTISNSMLNAQHPAAWLSLLIETRGMDACPINTALVVLAAANAQAFTSTALSTRAHRL